MKRRRIALPWMAAISLSLLAAIGFAGCEVRICPRDHIVRCPKGYKKFYGKTGRCCVDTMGGCCEYQLCGEVVCRHPEKPPIFGFEKRQAILKDKGRICVEDKRDPRFGTCKKW